mmetsp:Transcript_31133/g.78790  ORF Transcript_31133/g.78790 Transcript_31133/m.78790 type:complete len:145 (+) Transcript_31133:108-542(+)
MGNACCADRDETSTVSVVTTRVGNQKEGFPLPTLLAADPNASGDVVPKGNPALIAEVPDGASVLTFRTPDASQVPMVFTKKPIGIDFCKSLPVSVKRTHPGGVAEEMGIKSGWVLVRVNDVDLQARTFPEIQELLVKFAMGLPS